MLPKLMLVMLMIGKNYTNVVYVVQFPTEAQCIAEAKKINEASDQLPWYTSLPRKRAECVFNLTK